MLGLALGAIGTHVAQTSVDLRSGETFTVIVTGAGTGPAVARRWVRRRLCPAAGQGEPGEIPIEIGEIPGGTRLAWSLPLAPGSAR